MIFASEVPVIANLNKYRNIEDVFYEVWSRTDHTVVEHLESELSVPTLQEQEKILITESGADELRRQALEQSSTIQSTQELNEVAESLSKGIQQLPNVKEEVKSHLIQTVKSEIQKDYGSRLESKAIEDYEAKEKVKVYDSNLKFHKIPIGKVNDTEVWVGGRIDGKVGERVVEVKNRMKRFMNPLPKYDVAQLQTYLHILDSPEGELVEHLRKKEGVAAETHSTIIKRDDIMWENEILPNLISFANSLILFMQDSQKQMQFLCEDGKGKKKIIKSCRSYK